MVAAKSGMKRLILELSKTMLCALSPSRLIDSADGTFYLPDFTITWRGEEWYWEHLGMLHQERYRNHWETKRAWYEKHGFANRLITTSETSGFDSTVVLQILQERFEA